jgi:hypothetical protein
VTLLAKLHGRGETGGNGATEIGLYDLSGEDWIGIDFGMTIENAEGEDDHVDIAHTLSGSVDDLGV